MQLEHMRRGKAERTETVQPGEKKDWRDLISAQEIREGRTRLFSAVPSNKMRNDGNKLKYTNSV